MRAKPWAWQHGTNERPAVGSRLLATPNLAAALPTWESFPAADRHRLVSAILQAARRQVEVAAKPVSCLPKA
jgi:hypothetical protein